MKLDLLSKLQTLPQEAAICLELQEGIPVFRASSGVQGRIEALLEKQQLASITLAEEEELDAYETMDDYISLVNRTVRNNLFADIPQPA